MSGECLNFCVAPDPFPKRPNNRPGLDRIGYRIGSYADFREAMFRRLNLHPLLQGWTHRAPDDPGVALIEGAAIVGDILSFYQEHYANEAFLRTAQWRESVSDLVRLVGYRLAPGVGGHATFAFEVKGKSSVTIPAALPIKAELDSLADPADFETTEDISALPNLSRFHLHRPHSTGTLGNGTKVFALDRALVDSGALALEPGDRLMLVSDPSSPTTYRQTAVVASTEERFDTIEVTLKGEWLGGNPGVAVHAYKLGRAFRHFGHSAPVERPVTSGAPPTTTMVPVPFGRQFSQVPGGPYIVWLSGFYYPLGNFNTLPLDSAPDDVAVGGQLLVKLQLDTSATGVGTEYLFARTITGVDKASLSWGALTGPSTIARINASLSVGAKVFSDIRTIEIWEVLGQPFLLKAPYEESALAAGMAALIHFGDLETYTALGGRRVCFVGSDGSTEQTTVTLPEVIPHPGGGEHLRSIYLSPPLESFGLSDFPLLSKPLVDVFGNLAEATQGKTEKEVALGNGDNRQTFQTFRLPKKPLTYHPSAGATPPESPELTLYVNDRAWTRVPSLFGHHSTEEIYVVREDEEGNSYVQFGDGKTGARLPSGKKNVTAVYRTGVGAHGFLKEGATPQVGTRVTNLDKAQLPGVVSGGAEPETGDKAREAAPGKIQSLGRLVSLRDFETETLAIAGVVKAAAAWGLVDNVPTLTLTVLLEAGREAEFESIRGIIAGYEQCRGPDRFPVVVAQAHFRFAYLDLRYAFDPLRKKEEIETALREALGVSGEAMGSARGLFSLSGRRLGEREYATRIAGTAQNIEGIRWCKVTALGLLPPGDDPAALGLPASPRPLHASVPCESSEFLQLNSAHLQLSPAPADPLDPCEVSPS